MGRKNPITTFRPACRLGVNNAPSDFTLGDTQAASRRI